MLNLTLSKHLETADAKMAFQGKYICALRAEALTKTLHLTTHLHAPFACPDPSNPLLYRFSDTAITPDPYYSEDYAVQHKGKKTAIVIDNGRSQCWFVVFADVSMTFLHMAAIFIVCEIHNMGVGQDHMKHVYLAHDTRPRQTA